MVLYIALNGKNNELNNKLIKHLQEFYTKKQYKVTIWQDQPKNTNTPISTPSLLLNRALQRSKNNNNLTLNNDLILINGSIITDYQIIHDTNIPRTYVTSLNKYNKTYDLYITINNTQPLDNIPRTYNHIQINNHDPDKLFQELVQTIFDNLPRCQWCGKLFQTTRKHYKYCSDKCSEYAWEEHNRKNNREYYKRNKTLKQGLGSKNAYLSTTPEVDPLRELAKVRKAKRSLGL